MEFGENLKCIHFCCERLLPRKTALVAGLQYRVGMGIHRLVSGRKYFWIQASSTYMYLTRSSLTFGATVFGSFSKNTAKTGIKTQHQLRPLVFSAVFVGIGRENGHSEACR